MIKFNWGTALALIYVSFMIFMIGVVIASRRHDVNLVSKDYYQRELDYDQVMEAKRNYEHLPGKVKLHYDGSRLAIQFPEGMSDASGKVLLFRPSDRHQDKQLDLKLDDQGKMTISTDGLSRGLWIVKIKWEKDGKPFRYEETVHL